MTEPLFFPGATAWREWLQAHHAASNGLLVGLMKVGHEKDGLAYREALDEALCFGWIDGRRTSIDAGRWMIRFSRRRPRSNWSAVNLRHVERLKREGRMTAAGLAACDRRDRARKGSYSFENDDASLAPEDEARFRADETAWSFFTALPKSYRHPAIWWVVSAKRPETRERRLAMLVADSAAGRRVKHLRRPGQE